MTNIQLFIDKNRISPYAMSVYVALKEKGLSFDETMVDLDNKENKLLNYGSICLSEKVPCLQINDNFTLFESLAITEFLENKLTKESYEYNLQNIEDSLEFIGKANIGQEFMSDVDIKRVDEISLYKYYENSIERNFLSDDEVYNISIRKGTLTKEEKDIMNSHATLSYEMLSALPFPKKYSNIMHIAVNHHEKLNGKGYPRGLSEQEIALEDRILILADIFEALSSNDRPYKGVKTLSEIFKILDFMVKDGEIDKDLLDFFKNSRAFKEYCETELLNEQLDV